jgi:hypothetical protein
MKARIHAMAAMIWASAIRGCVLFGTPRACFGLCTFRVWLRATARASVTNDPVAALLLSLVILPAGRLPRVALANRLCGASALLLRRPRSQP